MYPSEYLAACDLHEKDAKVTIDKIEQEQVPGTDGTKKPKWVFSFKDKKKRMVMNKTNLRQISRQHGNEADNWIGKSVVLYPTTCQAFGETKECIRVR